jgi:hypothetical protein
VLSRSALSEIARLVGRSQDILAEIRSGPASDARQRDLLLELRQVHERIVAIVRPATDSQS